MLPDLNRVIEQVSKEKGIDRDIIVKALEEAMLSAAKRTFGLDRNIEGPQFAHNPVHPAGKLAFQQTAHVGEGSQRGPGKIGVICEIQGLQLVAGCMVIGRVVGPIFDCHHCRVAVLPERGMVAESLAVLQNLRIELDRICRDDVSEEVGNC